MLIATFGRKQDNPAIVLTYAALEGLFLGAFSFVIANLYVSGVSAGALIGQAGPRHLSASSSACWSYTRPAPSG